MVMTTKLNQEKILKKTNHNTNKLSLVKKIWKKKTQKLNLNQKSSVTTVHVCVHIIVYNCDTWYSRDQFWLSSLLSARQSS